MNWFEKLEKEELALLFDIFSSENTTVHNEQIKKLIRKLISMAESEKDGSYFVPKSENTDEALEYYSKEVKGRVAIEDPFSAPLNNRYKRG